ncbi:hypothetical protein FUAX_34160 [Fulvitalea axinellae]|uniref:Rhomboid family intramembrane serine protease n=1 Tax=Fulvitalea axinellae TaxID=1182444 RepID=A0AAU9D8T8_9BACT|nr:hypothetical protein FUAX_34160 [Fulvitalea axinellae]
MGLVTFVVLLVCVYITYRGRKDKEFLSRYSLDNHAVLVSKEYRRLLTSGFVHADWRHLGANMLTLYLFSYRFEETIGLGLFAGIFFGSLLAGNLFALFINRHRSHYQAVGASGAVSGVMFAAIAFFPSLTLRFVVLPIFFPGWIYGLAYILYSIAGIRRGSGNIGHEAHLAGGIFGMATILAFYPNLLFENPLPIAAILVPSLVFLVYTVARPDSLLIGKFISKPKKYESQDDRYNSEKVEREQELNKLLDKINDKGIERLSEKEKEQLEELSETL